VKIYTRTGDSGQTSLVGGKRISKTSAQLDAYGTIDELNAVIGLAIEELLASDVPEERQSQRQDLTEALGRLQNYLFSVGGIVATESGSREKYWGNCPIAEWTTELEQKIDELTEVLPKLESFVLPRGSKSAAQLHIARTVARRAERKMCLMDEMEPQSDPLFSDVKSFTNRISDFLFVAARFALYVEKKNETYWISTK